MNGTLSFSNMFSAANARSLAAPLFIVLILAMLVLPLPTFLLDILFTFNIALSINTARYCVGSSPPNFSLPCNPPFFSPSLSWRSRWT